MTTEEIHQWADGQYWFQGFPWLKVQRSDSQGVWKFLARDNYSGASVLEIGCHTGFYSFQASKAGATVTGTDIDEEKIERSRFINDHIEMQDATFICEDFDTTVGRKWRRFDYVFCLSVLH